MQNIRKTISLVLALVMLASVFTLTATAGAPELTGTYKTVIAFEVVDADGNLVTEVNPGQVVTVNAYGNSSVESDQLTALVSSVYFDPSVYTFLPDTFDWAGLKVWYDSSASAVQEFTTATTVANYTNQVKAWTDEEKAAHPGWTSIVYVTGVRLGSNEYFIRENKDNVMFSFDLQVKDDAAIGGDASIGCPNSVHYVSRKMYNYLKSTNTGTLASNELQRTAETTLAVTEAVSAPSCTVNHVKDQIRFRVDTAGSYANAFDYRVVASIDGFADQAELEANVTEAGFIFNKGGAVDKDTAIAQIKAGSGDYTQIKKAYISTDGTFADFAMACMVSNIPDAAKGVTLSTLAYVVLTNGDVVCFDAVITSNFNALYSQYYSQAFPA